MAVPTLICFGNECFIIESVHEPVEGEYSTNSPHSLPRASLILYHNEHHISTCRWYFPIGTVLSFIFTVVLENMENMPSPCYIGDSPDGLYVQKKEVCK